MISALILFAVGVKPLVHAHSHNDYDKPRPLAEALELGFCSIEADVFLVDGDLLVAHDRNKVDKARTLKSMYLEPLNDLAKKNRGRIYPGGPQVTLLVDIKADGEKVYQVLKQQLKGYPALVQKGWKGALSVVISGDRPIATIEADKDQLCSIDGRAVDLDSESRAVSMISENWMNHFKYTGLTPISDEELAKLKDFIKRAHAKKRKLRFWATAERPVFWKTLLDAGVDLIGTDKNQELADFLRSR